MTLLLLLRSSAAATSYPANADGSGNRLLIDIELYNSSTGATTKQGYGPIVSCTNWQSTARLNRAGDFTFAMPATDGMAHYARPKSYARCWSVNGEGFRCLGYGRIERVELRETSQGPMLDISGTDLLGELADRVVRRTSLREETEEHPSYVTAPTDEALNSTLYWYDNEIGDTDTSANLEIDDISGTPFVIGSIYKFHKVRFVIGGTFNDSHTVTFEYSSNDTWKSLSVTDGTTDGSGHGLYQSGYVTFTPPSDWEPATGEFLYKVKVNAGSGDSGEEVEISDIAIVYYAPTNAALGQIMSYAPAGWSLDGDGYNELQYRSLSGTELVENEGFETYATVGANEVFDNWSNNIQGSATVTADTVNMHGDAACVKLTTVGAMGGDIDWAVIDQIIPVTGTTEYTLTFWTRGDGTHDGQWIIADNGLGLVYPEYNITNWLDTGISSTTWTQKRFTFQTPSLSTSIKVAFSSPVEGSGAYALFDDVSLQAGGGNTIYLQCSDETVLEMLVRCAEVSGENFILSPAAFNTPTAREVLWLGDDETDCGVRALSHVDPIAVEGEDSIALITELTEIEDAAEIVSRVYPYGAGMGGSRVTLADCTAAPPAGYVVSTADNYVERTATVAVIGQVEVAKSWTDIVSQTDDTTAAAQNAANVLMIQAVNWLATHSCTSTYRLTGDVPRFYALSVAKCATLIYPGYKIRVTHHRWVDGYHAVSIDRDLWITATTWRVTQNGVETVALEVATVARPALTDALATATSIRRIVGLAAHNTASGY
jgi:hypothetical protein